MRRFLKKFSFVAIPALTVMGALLLLPMHIPHTMSVPGKVQPWKEWVLVHSSDGIISAAIMNHELDFAESCGNTQADRGDQASFRFHPDVTAGGAVSDGDTIGFVYSYDVEFAWAQLRGELRTELATLRLYESGEKESLVREARLKLDYARKQVEQQRREMARLNSLAEKDMLAPAEMERAQTTLQLLEIQANTAEAALTSVRTGYKKEQIDLSRARIQTLREEIHVMEKRMGYSTILTPVSGRLFRFAGSDTLAVVQDTTRYVLVLPVKWEDRVHLRPGQTVTVTVEGTGMRTSGTIKHVGNDIRIIGGSHLVRAVAEIPGNGGGLAPGLIVQCSIRCQPISVREYVLMLFR